MSELAAAPPQVIDGIDALLDTVGTHLGTSDWLTLDQPAIDAFANATHDDYWGHVDPVRSAETEFGRPIAHGLLTLSLHPSFFYKMVEFRGFRQLFNYGYDRIRFPAAVPAGSRVRMTASVEAAQRVEGGARATFRFVFESDTAEKPVCIADYVQFFTV